MTEYVTVIANVITKLNLFPMVLPPEGTGEFSPGFQPELYTQIGETADIRKASLDDANGYRLEACTTLRRVRGSACRRTSIPRVPVRGAK